MALLHFSFAGESINAAPLKPKFRRFEWEFDAPARSGDDPKTRFTVECVYSVEFYALNLVEALHMAAAEYTVNIDQIHIYIIARLKQKSDVTAPEMRESDVMDVVLEIYADVPKPILDRVLDLALTLQPMEHQDYGSAEFSLSMNSIFHLN